MDEFAIYEKIKNEFNPFKNTVFLIKIDFYKNDLSFYMEFYNDLNKYYRRLRQLAAEMIPCAVFDNLSSKQVIYTFHGTKLLKEEILKDYDLVDVDAEIANMDPLEKEAINREFAQLEAKLEAAFMKHIKLLK